jgi:hypothetical protein
MQTSLLSGHPEGAPAAAGSVELNAKRLISAPPRRANRCALLAPVSQG